MMKNLTKNLIVIAIAFTAPFLTLSAKAQAQTKNIVFLAGQRSHASGEHEFYAGCMLLAKALNQQSGLDVKATVVSGWPNDQKILDSADAIIIYSDGTSVIRNGWEKANQLAKKGTGLMFMHYAVHPDPAEGEKYFRPWIGAAMETGYSVNPHWVADMKTLPNHPVSEGVTDLVRAYDEFYYAMRFQKDRGKVLDLVTATPTKKRLKRIINMWGENGVDGIGKTQTLMWGVEREDGGRGVGFVGGHYHRNWAVDGFRQIVLNSIVWVAGMDVPEGGVKSKTVDEDQLNTNLDSYPGRANPRIPLPNIAAYMELPPAKFVTAEEHAAEKKARREASRKKREMQKKKQDEMKKEKKK